MGNDSPLWSYMLLQKKHHKSEHKMVRVRERDVNYQTTSDASGKQTEAYGSKGSMCEKADALNSADKQQPLPHHSSIRWTGRNHSGEHWWLCDWADMFSALPQSAQMVKPLKLKHRNVKILLVWNLNTCLHFQCISILMWDAQHIGKQIAVSHYLPIDSIVLKGKTGVT